MIKRKKALSLKLKQLKLKSFDLVVDFDSASSGGHLYRAKMLIKNLGYGIDRIYKIEKKSPNITSPRQSVNKGILIDSFYLNDAKIQRLASNYRFALVIDDGPLRRRSRKINYLNWDLGRHLTKRYHGAANVYSGICFFPAPQYSNLNTNVPHPIFVYTSNDGHHTVLRLVRYLKQKFNDPILVIGKDVAGLISKNVIFMNQLDEVIFNEYLKNASVVVSPGGFTFYKAMRLGKHTYIYQNENENVGWERSIICRMGGGLISEKIYKTEFHFDHTKKKDLIVGVLFSGEPQIETLLIQLKKIRLNITIYVFSSFENYEAHSAMYKLFNRYENETRIKIDADMTVADMVGLELRIKEMQATTNEIKIDKVFDFYSGRGIYGVHVFGPNVKLELSNERLSGPFVDDYNTQAHISLTNDHYLNHGENHEAWQLEDFIIHRLRKAYRAKNIVTGLRYFRSASRAMLYNKKLFKFIFNKRIYNTTSYRKIHQTYFLEDFLNSNLKYTIVEEYE